jgi:hypothetical protein
MDERPVREGMKVYSADGVFVGRVIGIGDTHFQVERGLWVPRDYLADYADVSIRSHAELVLSRRFAELEQLHPEHYYGVESSSEPVNEP